MKPRSVLIADDEPDVRLVFELHMAMSGYKTFTAADGRQALELFCSKSPDVVLMDLEMPELDGASAVREMLEIKPDATIFVVSGHVDERRSRMLMAEGARGVFAKPLDMADLEHTIELIK